MRRRRFSEREVVETLLQQGAVIRCPRCSQLIMLGEPFEREHFEELALGGADTVANCFYSHEACHAIATNGTKATTAGSSKHKIAKAKRLEKAKGGYARAAKLTPERRKEIAVLAAKTRWAKRPIPSRPFQKGPRPWR